MQTAEEIQIEGVVENVVFRSEETGFTVMEIDHDGELLTAVGELVGIEEGEEVLLTGCYTTHPNFGRQFKVSLAERRLPSSAHAIYKYLASGTIKGVGPVLARRLVDAFGSKTLEIAESEPEKLTAVRGVSPAKAQAIGSEMKRVFGIRSVMMFLAAYRIPPANSVKVWKKYGMGAVDVIKVCRK